MPGNRGIGDVREAQFHESRRALPAWLGITGAFGQKPIHQHTIDVRPRKIGLERAGEELAASTQHGHWGACPGRILQQHFLGLASTVREQDHLPNVELGPLGGKGLARQCGQGEVHVVAAKEQMVAYGQPRERQVAIFLADFDEGEVGGPAADIRHENQITGLHLLAPAFATSIEPGVKRGLRLFEEGELIETRCPGRLHGQFACNGIERCRHRKHDILLLEPVRGDVLGHDVVPRLGEVLQIAGAGIKRGDLAGIVRGVPGKDWGLAVDSRMAEPRLRGGDEPGGTCAPNCGRTHRRHNRDWHPTAA